jgi:hypothetical protein
MCKLWSLKWKWKVCGVEVEEKWLRGNEGRYLYNQRGKPSVSKDRCRSSWKSADLSVTTRSLKVNFFPAIWKSNANSRALWLDF